MARLLILTLLTVYLLQVLLIKIISTSQNLKLIKHKKISNKEWSELNQHKLWPEDVKFMRYIYGASKIDKAMKKNNPKSLRKLILNLMEAKDYLTRFGYLAARYKEKGISLHGLSEEQQNTVLDDFRAALRNFQRFSHNASVRITKVTGKLDKETIVKMKMSRCALYDLNLNVKSSNVERIFAQGYKINRNGYAKWRTKYLTYKIANYPSNGNLDRRDVDDVFAKAFSMWSRHIPLNFFQLRETDSDSSVDIVIKFKTGYHGDGVPFDGRGGVLAHAFYPSTVVDDDSLAGDMHFDDDETFTLNAKQDANTDLLAVASHELGHALGLEHSSLESAVMYPLFHKGNQLGRLSQDDIDGIQQLYCRDANGKFLDACAKKPDSVPLVPPTLPTSRAALVTTPRPTPRDIDKPDPCNTTVDAVLNLRKMEIQFFKGPYFWRVIEQVTGENAHYYQLYFPPSLRDNFWVPLPIDKDHIDATFERSFDNVILFFRGRRFWAMANNHALEENFPREGKPLTSLGLPDDINKIDAMFSWKGESTDSDRNRRIFIFSGDKYWRYVERHNDLGGNDCVNDQDTFGCVLKAPLYPRPICDTWIGVPTPVDTAYTHEDHHTFFFKDKKIYRFNNIRMRVESRSFQNSELSWLGCNKPHGELVRPDRSNKFDVDATLPSTLTVQTAKIMKAVDKKIHSDIMMEPSAQITVNKLHSMNNIANVSFLSHWNIIVALYNFFLILKHLVT